MIKIGIPVVITGDHWLGGLNYFKSLAKSLNSYPDKEIHVYFLTNKKAALQDVAGPCVEVVECPGLADFSIFSRFVNFALGTSWGLIRAARKYKLNILTHAMPGKYISLPTLYWMPDFQHCVLSDIFTKKDKWGRDRGVKSTLRFGHILLSSFSAEKDFRRYYPSLAEVQSHVLQFTPVINLDKGDVGSVLSLKEKYQIEGNYFYLPNQFWRHKNHRIVVEALKLLPDDFQVVCSGAISDYRGTAHIDEIKKTLKDAGLETRFKMLGVVSREDVYCLMEHALAVINPSFFEGWSTTVEEAKYSGKRLILSDLDVHQEQNPLDALFFNPESAADLAEKMQQAWNDFELCDEEKRVDAAKLAYPTASEKFAHDYVKIIKALIKG